MSQLKLCNPAAFAAALLVVGYALVLPAAEPQQAAAPAAGVAPEAPGEEPLVGYDLSHKVDFKLGDAEVHEGDLLTIDEVTGTAETFAPRNLYLVKGHYRLASADRGRLSVHVRLAESAGLGGLPSQKLQNVVVHRGAGRFSLIFYMWAEGKPHVALHPETEGPGPGHTGPAVADIFFGTDEPQPEGQPQKGAPAPAPPANPQAQAMVAGMMGPIVGEFRRERDKLAAKIEAEQTQLFALETQLSQIEQKLGKAGGGGPAK